MRRIGLALLLWAFGSITYAGSCASGGCTLDTGQTVILPAANYRYIDIKNQDNSITISCNFFGNTAVIGGAGSFDIVAQWHRSFPDSGDPQFNYVPSGPVSCTAASGTPNITVNFMR